MPVTILTADHDARSFPGSQPPKTVEKFFDLPGQKILSSNFDPREGIRRSPTGFVSTVVQAYSEHYNLVIRPDDIWLTILSQLSYHINSRPEEFRHKFVSHEGKKTLKLKLLAHSITEVDGDKVADQLVEVIDKALLDKELKEWVLPAFSTTEIDDRTCAAILMFASLKEYFNYNILLRCGIPSVTLQGTKEDWIEIHRRLEKLDSWNETTQAWKVLLEPIMRRFIAAFDGDQDEDFWAHIGSPEFEGSGTHTLGGWITAFCVFQEDGQYNGNKHAKSWGRSEERYSLDEAIYPIIAQQDIPREMAEVDINLVDFTGEMVLSAVLMAGNLGMKVERGEGLKGDTVQSVPIWGCYLKDNPKAKGQTAKPLKRAQI
jgi:hypothetical protein